MSEEKLNKHEIEIQVNKEGIAELEKKLDLMDARFQIIDQHADKLKELEQIHTNDMKAIEKDIYKMKQKLKTSEKGTYEALEAFTLSKLAQLKMIDLNREEMNTLSTVILILADPLMGKNIKYQRVKERLKGVPMSERVIDPISHKPYKRNMKTGQWISEDELKGKKLDGATPIEKAEIMNTDEVVDYLKEEQGLIPDREYASFSIKNGEIEEQEANLVSTSEPLYRKGEAKPKYMEGNCIYKRKCKDVSETCHLDCEKYHKFDLGEFIDFAHKNADIGKKEADPSVLIKDIDSVFLSL